MRCRCFHGLVHRTANFHRIPRVLRPFAEACPSSRRITPVTGLRRRRAPRMARMGTPKFHCRHANRRPQHASQTADVDSAGWSGFAVGRFGCFVTALMACRQLMPAHLHAAAARFSQ